MLSGFRVPCIVVSPFSRIGATQAAVTHNFYDHTSVLKLIEWRWGLEPLTRRDASHAPTDPGNLATALNFSHPVTKVPALPVLPPFTPTACGGPGVAPRRLHPGRRGLHPPRRPRRHPRRPRHLDRTGRLTADGRLGRELWSEAERGRNVQTTAPQRPATRMKAAGVAQH